MWPFTSKRKAPDESPSPGLQARVAGLEADVAGLRREIDDLDESLRSFKGRVAKRAGLDETPAAAPPQPAPGPTGRVLRFDPVAIRRGGGGFPGGSR